VTAIWKQFERRYIKPQLRRLKPWRELPYGDVRVSYKSHLDGGGSSFGQDFIPFFRDRKLPRQGRVFEWCAGPGFIGFSMLGYGLCDTLCVADVNPEAVEACRRTVQRNGLAARVSVYRSDNLRDIPAYEQWDLIVSNPPHFLDIPKNELRFDDSDWHIHRDFFATVGHFLKPGGVIVLQDNNFGSTAETFRKMIEAAGLSIVFVDNCEPETTPYSRLYYLGIMRRGETPPAWAGPKRP
jgi:tRNA1(Val) A37 N6-methylase TrmN6